MATRRRTQLDRQADAVMEASRVIVAIMARSLAELGVSISLPQWRVLVIVSRYGPLNMTTIAEWMGVHPSQATRASDALVSAGLLERREDSEDRRRVVLSLTRRGHEVVDAQNTERRNAIIEVLRTLPPDRRARLADALGEFADAAGASPEELASALGWPH